MRLSRLLVLGLLAACHPDNPADPALVYYFTYDPRSLDPALSTDVPSGEVSSLLFETLTRFDAEGALVPGLASSWSVDATGTTYTFHVRSGVSFHDGRALDARDVEASFRRVLAPGSTGGRAWPLLPIRGARDFSNGKSSGISGITVPDDTTLIITLDEPLNVFPKLLAMPVASVVPTPTALDFDQHPIGSGPWRFVRWDHDDRLLFAKNAKYWGGAPKSDTLMIRTVPEALTQAAEYESERLSVVEVPVGETRRWEKQRPQEIQRRVTIRDVYVAMNTQRGALRDLRVRRALNLAMPTDIILDHLMSGRGVRAAGAIPPGIAGYDSTRKPFAYDTAAARTLLIEAGYPNGISLKLWRSPRSEWKRVVQAMQQEWARVGIKIEIVERDAASARATARKGDADLYFADWYADYPDAENFSYPLFHSKNAGTGGNYAFLRDPSLDSLLERARRTTDSAQAVALWREADRRAFEAAPWVFLWFPVDQWAQQPAVTGWRIPLVFTGQRWMDAAYGHR